MIPAKSTAAPPGPPCARSAARINTATSLFSRLASWIHPPFPSSRNRYAPVSTSASPDPTTSRPSRHTIDGDNLDPLAAVPGGDSVPASTHAPAWDLSKR